MRPCFPPSSSSPSSSSPSRVRESAAGAVGVLLAVMLVLGSRQAEACGGLFCNGGGGLASTTQVNQTAERILFAVDEDAEEITAVIEILYEGPADRFAWLLPVNGSPEVGVSNASILDELQRDTNLSISVFQSFPRSCFAAPATGTIAINPTTGLPYADSGPVSTTSLVSVISAGSSGPYEWETISVLPGVSDPAEIAVRWLMENDYDVGALGPEVLRPYLADGMNLIAVRLQKDEPIGAIRPLTLRYAGTRPSIPIRPTAVAAQENMGIMVFVLGSARAVPLNYLTIRPNYFALDWFNPGDGYVDLITAARKSREVGGHAFVTEFANDVRELAGGFLALGRMARTLDELQELWEDADSLSNEDLVLRLVDTYPPSSQATSILSLEQTRSLLQRFVAEDIELERLLAEPECFHSLGCAESVDSDPCNDADCSDLDPRYFRCENESACVEGAFESLDRQGLLDALQGEWIQPLEEATLLFEQHRYLTRLYTTLSPSEMTVDPVFGLNPDLGNVGQRMGVTLDYEGGCETDTAHPWTWGQERPLRGFGTTWPWAVSNFKYTTAPLVWRAEQLSTSGEGETVYEVGEELDQWLRDNQWREETGWCSASPGHSKTRSRSSWVGIALLVLVLSVRRRRS